MRSRSIHLGQDARTKQEVRIPYSAFKTHFHLIGGTGKGKTTAIHTLLHPLLLDPLNRSCFFIVDRLGNFSEELLLWMSSEFCTPQARERLVYIQPARDEFVATFNPLSYSDPEHGYYKVERATEIILRAWESVNIEAMPRLARWVFNAFWAAAQLGLTIADCRHFLTPGSKYHDPLLRLLPPVLQGEWSEISKARSGEAIRLLESSRNRLRPYFESDILRRMFGSTSSRLDVLRFMREGRIVLIDLAPRNRLSPQLANTIGSLIINEVLAVARSLPRDVRYPTYLLLDEFQNFVGPDIQSALPEVRQLGLRLILSHQSFSQLKRGDYDITSMIWQAQSRLIFGLQGEDADILAHEVAALTFDSRRIKDEIYAHRQRQVGHRIVELESRSSARGQSDSQGTSDGRRISDSRGYREHPGDHYTDDLITYGSSEGTDTGRQFSSGSSFTETSGFHQTLVPVYEEYLELSNRSYVSFDEQRSEWARDIRRMATGQALLRLVDDLHLRSVNVKRSAPGFLKYDMQEIARLFPQRFEAVDRLIAENFRSEFFASANAVDVEFDRRLQDLLKGRDVASSSADARDGSSPPGEPPNPFTSHRDR